LHIFAADLEIATKAQSHEEKEIEYSISGETQNEALFKTQDS